MEGAPALGTIFGGALIIAGGLVLVTFGQRRTALHEPVGVGATLVAPLSVQRR